MKEDIQKKIRQVENIKAELLKVRVSTNLKDVLDLVPVKKRYVGPGQWQRIIKNQNKKPRRED